MNKKAFVWLLFKKEIIFFLIGLVVGIILMYLVGKGIIPIGLSFCA